MRFDIACRVVDNYGDAGVALRLARTLVAEHGAQATLWIDDRRALARIVPGLDAEAPDSTCEGVRVRALVPGCVPEAPQEVVVEAFGCGLPDRWLDAMEATPRPPVWINLEYLSAEAWVAGAHGLPSPHPARPLRRWFFFPGFTRDTGGLLRERGLVEARDALARAPGAHAAPWTSLGLPAPEGEALTVSLFCYPGEALAALFGAWAGGDAPIACLVPEGVATAALDRFLRGDVPPPGTTVRAGSLALTVVPFVDQAAFDRRLWACDFNLVRGEDSFVRAQWAARPMAWHAYPQAGHAHRPKIAAFAERYGAALDAPARDAWRAFQDAFNEDDAPAATTAWDALVPALPRLSTHARRWADELARLPDLASQLVDFCRNRL
jgi:uncharacterized repeat protein (TIGR03837 family)